MARQGLYPISAPHGHAPLFQPVQGSLPHPCFKVRRLGCPGAVKIIQGYAEIMPASGAEQQFQCLGLLLHPQEQCLLLRVASIRSVPVAVIEPTPAFRARYAPVGDFVQRTAEIIMGVVNFRRPCPVSGPIQRFLGATHQTGVPVPAQTVPEQRLQFRYPEFRHKQAFSCVVAVIADSDAAL